MMAVESILALDLSTTGTGWALFTDNSYIDSGVFRSSEKDYFKRILDIESRLDSLLTENNIVCVAIEDYAFSRRSSSVTKLAELQGIIKRRLWLYDFGFDNPEKLMMVIPSTSWKKFCFNIGNLKKDQVLVKVLSKYGIEYSDDNEADAFCLGQLAVALWAKVTKGINPKNQYECDVLKKLMGVME